MTTDVEVVSDAPDIPAANAIRAWVEDAVFGSGCSPDGDVEVSVRIVDAAEIRSLNRQYRDKDYATNVLSFPSGPVEGLPVDASRPLGDIVICAGVVASEAAEQGKSPADHWGHMIVHGTLHLLGFDHETESEAREMESIEIRILAAKNVTDPYAGGL